MAAPLTVTRIPRPEEPVPIVAWPTFALFAGAATVWGAAVAAALSGLWPLWASTPICAVCAYLMFTVSHDAAHHSASSDDRLNTWIGRLSTPLFAPHAGFGVWRFVHMQHHRFTNHDDGNDPDAYTMGGPSWQRPFRWLTIDLHYLAFYLRRWSTRPRAELIEEAVQVTIMAGLIALAIATGHGIELLALYIVPQRLAVLFLAFAFDYLPHHGLHHTPGEDKLKTTRNRVGLEWLISPALLYQNYHLVHHLHPTVPFYKYISVWRRNEEAYLEGDPALSTVRGREITPDEYRRLRDLAAASD